MSDSKTHKGGRPALPEHKKVKNVISFKVNNDDLELLQSYTKSARKPQADVIREILFSKKLTIRYINEGDTELVFKIDELFEQYKIAVTALKKMAERVDQARDKELAGIRAELGHALSEQALFKKLLYEIGEQVKSNRCSPGPPSVNTKK